MTHNYFTNKKIKDSSYKKNYILICQKFLKFLFGLSLLFAVHCTDLPQPVKPNVPANNLLVSITTDFTTGFLSALDLNDNKIYRDILPVHSDSLIREHAGDLYIINRLGVDNITRIRPAANYLREYELSLGRRSNPHDIAFISANLAAISLYDRAELLFFDYQQGKIVGRLSLAAYSDADGLPESSAMYYHTNGFLYVTLQRLNRHGTGIWPPANNSLLLKIDPLNRTVVNFFIFPLANPISRLRYHAFRDSLIIAAPFYFGMNYQLDGGIVEFNLTTETFSVIITEAELGEEVTDCILVNNSLGFVMTQNHSFTTRLKAFDPVSKNILATLATSQNSSGFFADFLLHGQRLYLADRNYQNPGVRIFDINTFHELTTNAYNLGLPPFHFALLP